MGKLNTTFNGASAYYNRQTAHAVAAGNTAARHRDLRDRGLIGDRATASEIAVVEHRLALQMRARDSLAETGKARNPQGRLVGLAFFAAIIAAVVARRADLPGIGVVLVFVLTVAAVLVIGVPIMRGQEDRRARIVARADWNSRGVCRWCKSSAEHVVDGEVEHPLVAHAVEVDAAIHRR